MPGRCACRTNNLGSGKKVPAEKSPAIVLKVTEFSETSCVVTLYTRDFGKITGLAKGARRKNGPFESALDVLSMIRVVFLHKNTDSMDLLTEAKLERRFRSASSDWDRLNCAYYLIELLLGLTDNSDAMPELFDLADFTLRALDTSPESPFLILTQFEFQLLYHLGHAPMLNQCVACGQSMPKDQRTFFSALAGGLLCSDCRPGKQTVISLSQEAWDLMDQLSISCDKPKAHSVVREPSELFELTNRMVGGFAEVRETMNQFAAHLMGKRPRLQVYLRLPKSFLLADPPTR